jgi:hypothetical protein
MLKLKLIFSLVKKHLGWTFVISLILFFAYRELIHRNENKNNEQKIINLKRFYLQEKLKIEGAYHVIVQKNDSLNGVVLIQQNVILKYKKMIFEGKGSQIEKDGRKEVIFAKDTNCIEVKGWTLTDPPEWGLNIDYLPITLNIFITDIGDSVHGVITPFPPSCLNVTDVKMEASPELKGMCRDGFDKGEFLLGGVISIGIFKVLQWLF